MIDAYTYRDGKREDYAKIQEFINNLDFFYPITVSELGGQWLIAETVDGEIVGTIWCFVQVPHAYLDYWAGSPVAATKLALIAEQLFKKSGVKYVRGVIKADNLKALRLATAKLGSNMLFETDYCMVYKEINRGVKTDRDNNKHNSGCERTGTSSDEYATAACSEVSRTNG